MNVEEDCGDGSALRIRPEPSKLRTVCPEGSQKETNQSKKQKACLSPPQSGEDTTLQT